MTAPANNATFYADFKSLAALKREASTDSQKALRGAAQQFESLFINMMLKSMRDATSSIGDSLTGGNEMDLYQGMFDEQIATQMAKGKGLGLADLLVQQLNRTGLVKPSAAPQASSQTTSSLPSSNGDNGNSNIATGDSKKTSAVAPGRTTSHAVADKLTSHHATASAHRNTAVQFKSPADFVAKMWPHAQEAAKQLGVDPTTLIAHAALETGWGKHIPCDSDGNSSHNLFGIKAGGNWNGQSMANTTVEYSDGVAVKKVDRFKAYDSMAQCFADYASLLASHTRYSKTLHSGSNTAQFAAALQKGGYATDPDYAHKLKAVARSVMSLVSSIIGTPDTRYVQVSQGAASHADT